MRRIGQSTVAIEYVFPGTQFTDGKTVPVTWYDGAARPPREIIDLIEKDGTRSGVPGQGNIIVGTDGVLLHPHGGTPQLFPREKFKDFSLSKTRTARPLPRVRRFDPRREKQTVRKFRLLGSAHRIGPARLPLEHFPESSPRNGTPPISRSPTSRPPTVSSNALPQGLADSARRVTFQVALPCARTTQLVY